MTTSGGHGVEFWLFFLGCFVGGILTFRYVAIVIYHPIIRDLTKAVQELRKAEKNPDDNI